MMIKRTSGWEIADSKATPEAVFSGAARLVRGDGARCPVARPPRRSAGPRTRTPRRASLAGRAKRQVQPTARSPTRGCPHLQQLLRVRLPEEICRGGAEAEAAALDRQDRRHGREADRRSTSTTCWRKMPLEERLYRHRCVEAWSMAVPWSGFPMKALVDFAQAAGRRQVRRDGDLHGPRRWRPASAVLVSLALYRGADHGRGDQRARLPRHRHLRQAGAEAERRADPAGRAVEIRLQDRSSRSSASSSPTSGRSASGSRCRPSEYGFWANVNPEVPHPRWSQATEKRAREPTSASPTQLYNGYGEFVAGLYEGRRRKSSSCKGISPLCLAAQPAKTGVGREAGEENLNTRVDQRWPAWPPSLHAPKPGRTFPPSRSRSSCPLHPAARPT